MPTDSNAQFQTLDLPTQQLPPEERLQRMVETMKYDLKQATGKDQAGENFARMVEASPHAKNLLLQAVEQGDLVGFSLTDGTPVYDPTKKRIYFDGSDIGALHLSETLFGQYVGTLGHEAQHAVDRSIGEKDWERFVQGYLKELHPEQGKFGTDGKFRLPPADITHLVGDYTESRRDSESRAELAFFNSVSSMVGEFNHQVQQLCDEL